ncbi:MAG: Rrf2 family transcriptional regulator [Arachidicoccus sp.]|nr:Rrf2 family transcriptional regulator [Arachidicoccus sp.]
MSNTKFATYLHILTLMAKEGDIYLSSEYLSSSINIHPVIIRKNLSELRSSGLIESKEGKTGGSKLARPAKKIKLSEIYNLVNDNSALGKSNTPNPACNVGKQINKHLEQLYETVDKKIIKALGKESLQDFANKFK